MGNGWTADLIQKYRGRRGGLVPFLVLALAVPCLSIAQTAAATTAETPLQPAARHAPRVSTLEQRVQTLTKALNLDERQQVELRKVLQSQREQVTKVWNDESIPAAYRVGTTKAIENRTADQIRTLLNDEQKQKYNPPRPPHEAAAGSNPSVEDWMSRTRPK